MHLPGHLEGLADRARDYIEAASSSNTRRAYAADWRHFASWCRRQGLEMLPPDPQTVGLYITACASGTVTGDKNPNSVSTIERRLSSLSWNFAQRGQPLDRKDRHIATVMAGRSSMPCLTRSTVSQATSEETNVTSPARQKSHGDVRSRPVVSKSVRLRVANRPPLIRAIAAIMPSGADIPRPWRTAAPMISP